MTTHDPQALDKALAALAEAAAVARDCFTMGDHDDGRKAVMHAIDALGLATHQIFLLNQK